MKPQTNTTAPRKSYLTWEDAQALDAAQKDLGETFRIIFALVKSLGPLDPIQEYAYEGYQRAFAGAMIEFVRVTSHAEVGKEGV